MDERLTELLARLRERFAPDAEPDALEDYLSSIGCDRREIGEQTDRAVRLVVACTSPDTNER